MSREECRVAGRPGRHSRLPPPRGTAAAGYGAMAPGGEQGDGRDQAGSSGTGWSVDGAERAGLGRGRVERDGIRWNGTKSNEMVGSSIWYDPCRKLWPTGVLGSVLCCAFVLAKIACSPFTCVFSCI